MNNLNDDDLNIIRNILEIVYQSNYDLNNKYDIIQLMNKIGTCKNGILVLNKNN